MTIEVARHLAGLEGANSLEFDEDAAHPVIATMADQAGHRRRQGRHGRHDAAGRLPGDARPTARWSPRRTAATEVDERHRHRYEVNNAYRDALTKAGLRISGTSPDGRLVEFVELDRELHPYFVATQAHPELKSRPTRPHPLFAGFVGAALDLQRDADRLPVEVVRRDGRRRVTAVQRPYERAGRARYEVRAAGASRPMFSVVSPTTVAMPGGGSRDARLHAPRRRGRRWWRSTTTTGSCWSASTGTRSAAFLWELPAGLIDVAGEPLVDAAARELAEEADLVAGRLASAGRPAHHARLLRRGDPGVPGPRSGRGAGGASGTSASTRRPS